MSQTENIAARVVADLSFDANGLVPAIAQSVENGEVLMLAYMNAEAINETLETGQVCYWSRSRQKLWRKGESSGHIQRRAGSYFANCRIRCKAGSHRGGDPGASPPS